MNVIKRNGDKEKFDISKIKKQLKFSIKDIKIDLMDLERKITNVIVDDIKTSDIQQALIQTTNNASSDEEPEWVKVSGKLLMWDIYSRVYKTTGFDISSYKEHIKYLVDNGFYKKEIFEKLISLGLEDEDIIDTGNIKNIGKGINDFNVVASQSMLLSLSYLTKNEKNELIEYPFLADIADALMLSKTKKEFYRFLYRFTHNEISLSTPFRRGLRRPNANLGSCYNGENIDSLAGIMKAYEDMAFISKEGGGIGWYWGKVRCSTSTSENIVKSKSINRWLKIVDDIADTVDQKGMRPGAITAGVDWWHMDFDSFLTLKSELGGDLREKAFSLYPQAIVDQYFIEAVYNNQYVYSFDHHEYLTITGKDITEMIEEDLINAHLEVKQLIDDGILKNYKAVNAKQLWKKIIDAWISIGDFYIVHKDMINFSNYLKYEDKKDGNYMIAKNANLCVESFSVTKAPTEAKSYMKNSERVTTETNGIYHSCNLLSINVDAIKDKDRQYKYEVMYDAVLILDRSIDLSAVPVLEAEKGMKLLRNIGIGFVGVADLMAWNKELYDTDSGREFFSKYMDDMAFFAYTASAELGEDLGSYPLFNPDNYDKLIGKDPEELSEKSRSLGNNNDWVGLRDKIKKTGIRNFYLLAEAPNTTTGFLMGVQPSYLPAHNKFNYQTIGEASIPVVCKYLEERRWYYKTKAQYDPVDIIKFTEAMQYYIDTGISMELLINFTIFNKIKPISDKLIDGFRSKKIKAIYYVISPKTGCTDCSN